jgi:hypothetical protein
VVPFAALLYAIHRENGWAQRQVQAALDLRLQAIRSEMRSRSTLLEVLVALWKRDGSPVDRVQDVMQAYRGLHREALLVLWAPWDSRGDPPRDWQQVRQFASPGQPLLRGAPGWLPDVLRRAAREDGMLCVPASTPDGSELLVLAAPVTTKGRGLKGVAILLGRLSEAVEHGTGDAGAGSINLIIEDVALGGRRLYQHGPPTAKFAAEQPLEFAGRKWKVWAGARNPFLAGNLIHPR